MRVLEIWRYPIKSIGGEKVRSADVIATGIRHDRGWGLRDEQTGNILTARREPRLLMASATVVDGRPQVTTSEGHRLTDDADFSEWLERPVTLQAAARNAGGTYEVPLDAENDAEWVSWQGPGDAWHDSDGSRLSIVSNTTLGDWDFRRFRSNILVDYGDEDELVGATIHIGTSVIEITKQISRCVMVSRPQPDLARDLDVLRTINRERDERLAIGAVVSTPGTISIGDELLVDGP